MILLPSALELLENKIIIMNSLIIDAAKDEFFFTHIVDKNTYTSSHENSKINFEKMMLLINEFLKYNGSSLDYLDAIYVNKGPGSFAAIRNSLSTIKALFLTKKIDYYCFSFQDFKGFDEIKYEDVPNLCEQFKIRKNLINPIYLS